LSHQKSISSPKFTSLGWLRNKLSILLYIDYSSTNVQDDSTFVSYLAQTTTYIGTLKLYLMARIEPIFKVNPHFKTIHSFKVQLMTFN